MGSLEDHTGFAALHPSFLWGLEPPMAVACMYSANAKRLKPSGIASKQHRLAPSSTLADRGRLSRTLSLRSPLEALHPAVSVTLASTPRSTRRGGMVARIRSVIRRVGTLRRRFRIYQGLLRSSYPPSPAQRSTGTL